MVDKNVTEGCLMCKHNDNTMASLANRCWFCSNRVLVNTFERRVDGESGEPMSTRILFIDLDGTIIEPKSAKDGKWSTGLDDWCYKDGVLEAIKRYNPSHLHIVTNRGDIKTGQMSEDVFLDKMALITQDLKGMLPKTAVTFDYAVAVVKDNDYRRKPNVGMLEEWCAENGLLRTSPEFGVTDMVMVGDGTLATGVCHGADELLAKNFGIPFLDIDTFIRINNNSII